jgi:lysozyme
MTDTFDLPALTAELSLDEGRVFFPYTDTQGYTSIGIGRNLSARGLSWAEIDMLFTNDVRDCCASLDAHTPWWRTLAPGRQRVMINLCFNLGWGSLAQFHHFLAAMKAGDWPAAAAELENSRWYVQVHGRGPRMVARLLAADPAAEQTNAVQRSASGAPDA